MHRYQEVAQQLEAVIRAGTFRPGDRLPSLRETCLQHRVSTTTAVQAYLVLENEGLIEARPKSGFFVRARLHERLPEPLAARPVRAVTAITVGALQSRLFDAYRQPGVVGFGSAAPSPELLPVDKLSRTLAAVSRAAGGRGLGYDMPPGVESLRRAIARRSLEAGVSLTPEDVITTCGATEALLLCLRAVTSPGDVVAVESPTYFGVLHALQELGLKAAEIPMHPRDGLDLDALEQAVKARRIAACVAVPNFANPAGSLMPDEHKRRLIEILARREVPLIEDDVFGELYFDPQRPRVALAFDRHELVLLCGSFSKTLAPGYRAGWIATGARYYQRVRTLKLTSSLATATLPQLAIAEFVTNGGYDHYLRSVRRIYERQLAQVSEAIADAFPAGVKISRPRGGFVLWVELPRGVDALRLDELALAAKISIAPGPLFSAQLGFRNYIRLSCANPWTPRVQAAIETLGRLVKKLL